MAGALIINPTCEIPSSSNLPPQVGPNQLVLNGVCSPSGGADSLPKEQGEKGLGMFSPKVVLPQQ